MKYITTNLALKTFSAAVIGLFAIASSLQAQTVLQQWNYNDANGTTFNNTTNNVIGGGSWAAAIPGVTTTGSGSLLIAYTDTTASARVAAPIATISSGIVQLDLVLSGWDVTGYDTTTTPVNLIPLFRMGLASGSGATLVANMWLSPTASGFRLSGLGAAVANNTPVAQDQILAGGLARSTPITLRLTADFDARTYSISNSDTGFSVFSNGTLAAANPGYVNFRVLNNFTTAGSGISVDSITLTSIPEPSTFALLGLAAGVFIYRFKGRKLKSLSY